MRYDAVCDCYLGTWLSVPAALLEETLTLRVQGGQSPAVALEDLLDELAWTLDTPGVRLHALERPAAGATIPWPLRFRVAVLDEDEARADALQAALERAGLQAHVYLPPPGATPAMLRGALAPQPAICLSGLNTRLASTWAGLQAALPACRFVRLDPGATPAEAGGVAQRVRALLLATLAEGQAGSELRLRRAELLRRVAADQRVRAQGYQSWARSLCKRSRRPWRRASCAESKHSASRTTVPPPHNPLLVILTHRAILLRRHCERCSRQLVQRRARAGRADVHRRRRLRLHAVRLEPSAVLGAVLWHSAAVPGSRRLPTTAVTVGEARQVLLWGVLHPPSEGVPRAGRAGMLKTSCGAFSLVLLHRCANGPDAASRGVRMSACTLPRQGASWRCTSRAGSGSRAGDGGRCPPALGDRGCAAPLDRLSDSVTFTRLGLLE